MNLPEPIGGFFELELKKDDFLHSNGILLNSGRSCFEYVLRANNPSRVYMPKFTCDVMLEPLTKLKIPYSFYSINEALEIKDDISLEKNEMLVYTNYFGLKDDYASKMAQAYGAQLILDYSQAFYSVPPAGSHTFYSPRKFFGIPDGGCLVTGGSAESQLPLGVSFSRASHLLKRIDVGPEASYPDFKANDSSLVGEPIEQMSRLTRRLLGDIDFDSAKGIRISNFNYLHERLKETNKIKINMSSSSVPMVYPYLAAATDLRSKLIENRIFVATYWPNVFKWCTDNELEHSLAANILPLPIDQRYGFAEMDRIVALIGHEK